MEELEKLRERVEMLEPAGHAEDDDDELRVGEATYGGPQNMGSCR